MSIVHGVVVDGGVLLAAAPHGLLWVGGRKTFYEPKTMLSCDDDDGRICFVRVHRETTQTFVHSLGGVVPRIFGDEEEEEVSCT